MGALQGILAYLIAMSLASERLVAILKTFVPTLSEEAKKDNQEVDLIRDRNRRLVLQGFAILSSWITVGLSAPTIGGDLPSLGAFAPFHPISFGTFSLPVILLAVLTSGGSALWNNVMGYTKAIKDTSQVKKAAETLDFHQQAKRAGTPASDAGQTAGVNKPS